jgi:hypothetical protein
MVGASNELPECEELAALFDRFLIRKLVKRVSHAGLVQMLIQVAVSAVNNRDSWVIELVVHLPLSWSGHSPLLFVPPEYLMLHFT